MCAWIQAKGRAGQERKPPFCVAALFLKVRLPCLRVYEHACAHGRGREIQKKGVMQMWDQLSSPFGQGRGFALLKGWSSLIPL